MCFTTLILFFYSIAATITEIKSKEGALPIVAVEPTIYLPPVSPLLPENHAKYDHETDFDPRSIHYETVPTEL